GGAFIALVLVTWAYRKLDVLTAAMNAYGSFKIGPIWKFLVGVLLPVVLGVLLVIDIYAKATEGYGGFDDWVVSTFGWGALGLVVLVAIALSFMPWRGRSAMHLEDPEL